MDKLVLEVNDYLAINKAKIEINKINVVGGVNSSGKSTLSRIFYSLLKGNSTKRRDYALQNIIDDINQTIDKLNNNGDKYDRLKCNFIDETIDRLNDEGKDYSLPKHLKITDNPSYIIRKYDELLEICGMYQKIAEIKMIESTKEIGETLDKLTRKLENDGFNINEICRAYKSEGFFHDDNYLSRYSDDLANAIRELDDIRNRFHPLNSFCYDLGLYESIIDYNSDYNYFIFSEELQEYLQDINKIQDYVMEVDGLLKIIKDWGFRFPILDFGFKEKMEVFFGEDSPKLSLCSISEIFSKEDIFDKHYSIIHVYGIYFELYVLMSSKIDASEYFFKNGLISSVHYVDNFSLMDLSEMKKGRYDFELFHINELIEDIYKKLDFEINFRSDIFQEFSYPKWERNLDSDVKNILEKINDIIHGSYENMYYGTYFTTNKKIKDKFVGGLDVVSSEGTSSGIKQIGIIQLLLLNDKLKKEGYLIIDEPEVNLHPEWQFKFAEILVMLARDLNITIYLNSHSPFFIEAIDAFTEFYEMQDDINYYLTEESEKEGKYDFTKIESDELYRIYDSLGRPYDLIDQLRLQKHLGE